MGCFFHPTFYLTHESPSLRIYPQSYVAASYAADFLNPDHVVGFPEGFPVAKELWCSMNLEKLMQRKTDLVLTAPYTHPRLMPALHACQIRFTTLKHPRTFPEITEQALEFCIATHHLDLGICLALTLDAFYAPIKIHENSSHIILLQDHGRLDFMRDPLWSAFTPLQEGVFSFEKLFLLKPSTLCIFSQLRTKEELQESYPALKCFAQVVVINSSFYHYPSFWNCEAVQAMKEFYETL